MLHAVTRIPTLVQSVVKQKSADADIKELLEEIEKSTEAAVTSFAPIRTFLKSRSSTDAYHALKLFQNLVLKSDKYITLLPTTLGQPLLISLVNIATVKKHVKNFKLQTGKLSKSTEFFGGQLIFGLNIIYQNTRYSIMFQRLQQTLLSKVPNFVTIESELQIYEQRNIKALEIIENMRTLTQPSHTNTSSSSEFDPDSLAENIKLLTEVFQANKNLRGLELKNNEIVNIVLEKIKSDQNKLIKYIDIISDSKERNKALLLNSNINELNDIFLLLVQENNNKDINIGTALKCQTPQIQKNENLENLVKLDFGNKKEIKKKEEKDIFSVLDSLAMGVEGVKTGNEFEDIGKSVEEFTGLLNKEADNWGNDDGWGFEEEEKKEDKMEKKEKQEKDLFDDLF